MSLTTAPNDPRLVTGVDTDPRPQNGVYLVLSEEELAKGFVRPFRDTYRHVGVRPKHPTRELTADEKAMYGNREPFYVLYEQYPDDPDSAIIGQYWTKEQLESGCGATTKMDPTISATYARDPKFYGGTYCVGCRKHLPVEEFVWTADGTVVGS